VESCLIADDHALVRDALAVAVASRWPATVIWEAADYPAAWQQAEKQPDLCLMDLGMQGSEPRSGVARLRQVAPDAQIVIVTATNDEALMLALIEDGVAGFVSKSASTAIILAAVELVLAGGRYFPPLLAEIAQASRNPGVAVSRLTARQIDVLRLVQKGETNKGIARVLGISPDTVKIHIAQAMSALGAVNRTDAALKARNEGVI
jgi:DNA-binding NarL/FixJ family response regulator